MKKSEVIEVISEFLDEHVTQSRGYAWKHSQESAETLLDMLIELGMLPPTTKLDKLEGFDNAWED